MSGKDQELFISSGKKPREELRLPTLHFIVVDDWIAKLGEKTFCSWLKLLSLVDRTDEAKGKYGNQSTVPRSLEDVTELFGMSKSTFYRNVIHPLWDYGLIDLVEWKESFKLGQKPINIIVYDYPQNSYALAVKPLEKCRDYKTQYNSNSAIFGRIGGQARKEESEIKKVIDINRFKNETVDEINGFKNETVDEINNHYPKVDLNNGFKNETVDGFKNETVTVSKMKPINNTNTLVNDSNTLVNVQNNLLKILEEEEENININTIEFLKNTLNYSGLIVNDIIKHMKLNNLSTFTVEQMKAQNIRIHKWIDENKQEIREFGYFFVNGILKHEPSRAIMAENREFKRLVRQKVDERKEAQNNAPAPLYNWLEN